MNKKYNEIKFRIDEKEKNDKEKYEELYKFSINMKNENSFYKNEINVLKDEIKNLKLLFENINEKVEKLEKENKNLELLIKKKTINQNWIESNIISNLNDKTQLKNWISLDKKINSKLLFRLSIHGETINKFHELCDNISNNLTIKLKKIIYLEPIVLGVGILLEMIYMIVMDFCFH